MSSPNESWIQYTNIDYWNFRVLLEQIENLIQSAKLESLAVDFTVEKLGAHPTQAQMIFAIFSLRAELLRTLLVVPSLREFSKLLSSSDLYADFCGIRGLDGIRWFQGTA